MFNCTCSFCKDRRESNRLLSCKGTRCKQAGPRNHSTSARNNQHNTGGHNGSGTKRIIQKNEQLIRLSLSLPLPKHGYNQEQAQGRATSGVPSPCAPSRVSRGEQSGSRQLQKRGGKGQDDSFYIYYIRKKYFFQCSVGWRKLADLNEGIILKVDHPKIRWKAAFCRRGKIPLSTEAFVRQIRSSVSSCTQILCFWRIKPDCAYIWDDVIYSLPIDT